MPHLEDFITAWRLLALGLGLVCIAPVCAGAAGRSVPSSSLVIRSWGTEDGLPQNTVTAITQTREGYLWLGTRDGLARFDGVRFTSFGLGEGLSSVDISSLHEDHQGTLWIGTIGGGLNRWVHGRVEQIRAPAHEPAGDTLTALAEDAEGRLWIGTAAGLLLLDAGHWVSNKAIEDFAQTPIRALLRSRSGSMWLATANRGLFAITNQGARSQPGPPGNERIIAYCLLEDQQGQIWASVGNGRVLCLRQGTWQVYDQTAGLPFAYVTSLTEAADGKIWAGSLDDGLYFLEGDRFVRVSTDTGLSANDIRSLRPDREGNLWVGTRTGGLNRLNRRTLLHYGVHQGLTNDFTRSLSESTDGTIWVATIGGGLYRGGLDGFQRFGPEPVIQFYAQAESVLSTTDGDLWWGGARSLLRWTDSRLSGCYTNEPWIRTAAITALCEDRQGGVWIGNSQGSLVHSTGGQFVEFPGRVASGPITALAQATNGFLWVGSVAGGLNRIRHGETNVFSLDGLRSRSIRTLRLDSEGSLWIGTAGGGLSRLREGKLANISAREGINASTVSQIVEDDYGFLWLGSNRGIFRVRKSELNDLAAGKIHFVHPRAYGINDGMPVEECSGGFCPAGLKTRSGLVCLSTVRGLIFLDPHRQEPDLPPPEVLLEEVLVNGKVLRDQVMVHSSANSGPGAPRLVIPPGGRDVELHFTAISFASPDRVAFRYRLEGLDGDWVEAGGRRDAFYHRIPAGDFTFQVRACNADGVWNEQGASLAISVQPYVWETRWFVAGSGLAGIGLFAALLRFLEQRKYKRRLAQLQTQHAIERERLRISQDMHDDIGSILTQVSQLSELGQSEAGDRPGVRVHFERIAHQARAAVQGLDEIIWATNPKNDNLPRFAEYVCRFADELFESSPVRCWQQVPTHLPDLPLGADVRHNVFLAVKEAFTNILKHARSTEVWLRLAYNRQSVELEIEDNGSGFVVRTDSPRGNGLGNMRIRLEECGGRAEVTSLPGRGTTVRFVFPMPGAGGPMASPAG